MSETRDWHPVALSNALETGTSAGARLFGEDIVVWRDNSGVAHVWEDRCPHRGMRLSFGFVRGDHIACLYHGWQYDTAGQCRYIPAHPDLEVPQTIKVPVYGAHEDGGMIWTQLAQDGAPFEPLGIAACLPVRSLYIDRPADGLLDAIETAATAFWGAFTTVEPSVQGLVAIAAEGHSMLIGMQPVSTDRTGLHLVLEPASDGASQEALGKAHAFALDLRYRLENPPPRSFAPQPHQHAEAV